MYVNTDPEAEADDEDEINDDDGDVPCLQSADPQLRRHFSAIVAVRLRQIGYFCIAHSAIDTPKANNVTEFCDLANTHLVVYDVPVAINLLR